MSKVLFENGVLKLVESENNYFLTSDPELMRVVFDRDCRIDRVCIKKGDTVTCDKNIKELIEKHIRMNNLCANECMLEGDVFEAHAHIGAITGLTMLLAELNGEVEY